MKKIFKFLALGVCAMMMSVSLGSCGFMDELTSWLEVDLNSSNSVEDVPSSDSVAEPPTNVGETSSNISLEETLFDHNLLPYEDDELGLVSHTYIYEDCTVTLSPLQAVVYVGQSFHVLMACSTLQTMDYELEVIGGGSRAIVKDKIVTMVEPGQSFIRITAKGLPHEYYFCYIYAREQEQEHVHDYEIRWYVEPDCETQGIKRYDCQCGDTYVKYTPTYHSWIDGNCDLCEETYPGWWDDEVNELIERGEVTEDEVGTGEIFELSK